MNIREFIEIHEGGYTVDHAGPTNYGISLRFLRANGYDIDGDGDIDQDDIKALTKDKAWELFVDAIFVPSGIYLINGIISDVLMDAAVNMGGGTAVKGLQRVLNRVGAKCKIDGIIGPKTIAALAPLPKHWIAAEILFERLYEYRKIVNRNENLEWAYKGWINRVLDLKEFMKDYI